jgi:type II secretory pathway component GspD/PulD (secretin)
MFKLLATLVSIALCSSISMAQIKVSVDERTNTLIVKAPPEIQKQIEILIKELDNPSNGSKDIKVIPLAYAYASDLAPALQNVMNIYKPIRINTANMAIGSTNWDSNINGLVLADTRTNQLIIISDKNAILNIEKIAKQLDKKPNEANSAFLTKLKNAKADSLSSMLNEISKK